MMRVPGFGISSGLKLQAVLLAASLGFGACAPGIRPAIYDMPLTAVSRPADVQRRWGEYRVQKTDSGYMYADSLISVAFTPKDGTFAFALENRTEQTVQVLWDEMAYVGPNGISSRVSPAQTRIMDLEKSHPPTPVPAKAKLLTVALPNDLIYDNRWNGYSFRDFIPRETALEYEGKAIRLVFPIRVQDTTNEYTFVFSIQHVHRLTKKEALCYAETGKLIC